MARSLSVGRVLCILAIALLPWGAVAPAGTLHDAVRSGDVATIHQELEAGADVESTDYFLGTPLHVAVVEGKPAMVRLLIDKGARVDALSEVEGRTALHLAAELGDVDMLALLLAKGADLAARDRTGKAAIHLATIAGHAEIIRHLLKAGSAPDMREPGENMTPLLLASLHGKIRIVRILVEAGADIEAAGATGRTPFFFATSMESYRNVGGDALIRYFMDLGVRTSPKDTSGMTPLQWTKRRNTRTYREIHEILQSTRLKAK